MLLNGSVGTLLIFVNLVIKDNVLETMFPNIQEINCLLVKVKIIVNLNVIILLMERSLPWGALYVEIIRRMF
jgi:hypothetical protein